MTIERAWYTPGTATETAYSGYTVRVVIPASVMTVRPDAVPTLARLILEGPSSEGTYIANMYIGHAASTGSYAFATTPVQVTVGGNSSFTLAINSAIETDDIPFVWDGVSDVVVSYYMNNSSADNCKRAYTGGCSTYSKVANDAATVAATGYTGSGYNPSNTNTVAGIEFDGYYGNDPHTVLLLHFDGADGSTTMTDTAMGASSSHTFTAQGNAQIDNAQYYFGGTSLALDGSGDCLNGDNSSDFTFGTGDFCIEMWFRPSSFAGSGSLYEGRPVSNGAYPCLYINTSGAPVWYINGAGRITGTNMALNTWNHLAVARVNGTTRIFQNGVATGSWADSTNYIAGGTDRPIIGHNGSGAYNSGWIDELRISKGHGRYSSNFVPPQYPFSRYVKLSATPKASVALTEFNGTSDYAARADLLGIADGKSFTISGWFRNDGSGPGYIFSTPTSDYFSCYITTGGLFAVQAKNSAGTVICGLRSNASLITPRDGNLHHFMVSVNLATTTAHMYIDGIDVLNAADGSHVLTNDTIDFTRGSFYIGRYANSATDFWDGALGQLYINVGTYVDLSNSSNRLNYYNNGPVDMGYFGSLPTGSRPILFMDEAFPMFGLNKGTGGNIGRAGAWTNGGLSMASGSLFSLTGQNAGYARTYKVIAEAAAYVLAGQNVNLKRQVLPLTASVSAFALTGQDVTMVKGRTMTADGAAFTAKPRTNYVRRSEDISNSAWAKSRIAATVNAITAPDGNLTADKMVEDTTAANSHYFSSVPASGDVMVAGNNYCWSIYAKAGERTRFRMYMDTTVFGGSLTNTSVDFDVSTGTVVRQGSNIADCGITHVGDGWYRCWVTQLATSSGTTSDRQAIYLINTGTTTTYDGDGVSGAYFWGGQNEIGTQPTAYIATAGSAVTVYTEYADLRVDRKAVADTASYALTGRNANLLNARKFAADLATYSTEKPSWKNYLLRSQEIDLSPWSQIGTTIVSPNAIVAPDGTMTADKTEENATTSTTYGRRQYALDSCPYNTVLTGSIYLKAAEYTKVLIYFAGAGGTTNRCAVNFDLIAGTVTASGAGGDATLIGASIEDAGNGWWRCIITGIPSASTGLTQLQVYHTLTPSGSTVHNGVVGSGIYMWGAQIELGSSATTYEPTGADHRPTTNLLVARKVTAGQGDFLLTGQNANLVRTFVLHSDKGTYTVTGKDAVVTWAAEVGLSTGTIEALAQALEITTDVERLLDVAQVHIIANKVQVDARGNTFTKVINSRSIEEVFIILVTIDHEGLEVPIRVANDNLHVLTTGQRGVISNGNEFVYLPFNIVLPNLERDTLPSAKIAIDNIDRAITAALADITEPPEVRIQIALSSDPDIIDYDIQGFKLNTVTYDEVQIEGILSVEYFANEPFPAPRFTPSRFPGLFRGRGSSVGA